jgi:flagellar assembly protein FliH
MEIYAGMNSSSRKVIKSEDVNFLQASRGVASRLNRDLDDPSLRSERFNLDKVKDAVTKKVQIAEHKSYEKGLSDGVRSGRELQKNETLQTLQAMASIVKETVKLKKSILENAEQQIIQLSLAIAEKVIHLEVTTNREVIRSVLKDAIKNIGDRENMKIRVNPQDFHFMLEIKSDFLHGFDGIKNIVFEEDESILRGGAVIETLCGEVDARLDQQYNEIKTLIASSA